MYPNNSNEEGSPEHKNIVGFDFKQVLEKIRANSPILEDGNLYIVDDLATDSSEIKVQSFFNRFRRVLYKIANKFFLLAFVIDLVRYFSVRTRVVFVLANVIAEVAAIWFESIKRIIVRKMFWGRGNIFKFTLQFLGVFLFVVGLVSLGYDTTSNSVAADTLALAAQYDYSSDLIVQNSSTKTQFAQNVIRIESKEYIVKRGDTLSSIAESFGLKTDTLLWANDLTANDFISVGEKIEIPPGDGVLVKVASGDTIEGLAKKYNSDPQTILDANLFDRAIELNSQGKYELLAGKQIFIPDGSITPPPAPKPVQQAPIYSAVVTPPPTSAGSNPPKNASGGGRFLNWPVAGGGTISRCLSYYHNGIDIYDTRYPNIVAAAPGRVIFAGCQSGYCAPLGSVGGSGLAWSVIVDHGNGFSTVYGHLNNIYVSSGQQVSTGQALGQMGQSGYAFGVHLHFMMVHSGGWNYVDPAPYMTTHVCGY